jgi:Cu-Zn family superoxide dismutase
MTAVAVFSQPNIAGEAVATACVGGTTLTVRITKLPSGAHGFHIHTAGDLRGEGCRGACSHWHKGSRHTRHGDRPRQGRTRRAVRHTERHTGDLGNIQLKSGQKLARYSYFLASVSPSELWGRTLIIHADPDDLGSGSHEDSGTTGHSGARIGCAIFGRGSCD